jgi:hypothetical protein
MGKGMGILKITHGLPMHITNEDGTYHTSRNDSHPPTAHSDSIKEEAWFTYDDENDEDLCMGPG